MVKGKQARVLCSLKFYSLSLPPRKSTGIQMSRTFKNVCSFTQSCPTLQCHELCSPPGSSVHGILRARILEWGTISFSKELLKMGKSSLYVKKKKSIPKVRLFLVTKIIGNTYRIDHDTQLGLNTVQSSFWLCSTWSLTHKFLGPFSLLPSTAWLSSLPPCPLYLSVYIRIYRTIIC